MIIAVLKQVFSNVRYLVLAGIVGFAVFAFSAWLPNLGLIVKVISSSGASLLGKITFLASLLGSIQTNFTFFSAAYTIAIAALFGINVAMVAYYFAQRKQLVRQTGIAASFGGLVSGILGIGCAACGTLVLGSPAFFSRRGKLDSVSAI